MQHESQTTIDWETFFQTARGWVFQAAPVPDDGRVSLGSMECIYQAFKARMEAEREQN